MGQIAEGKVRIAVAELRAEILPQLAEIKERIIGIDGNGTGRQGAIQVLEGKCDNIAGDVVTIDGKVDLLLTRDAETKGALGEREKDQAGRWWRQPLGTGLIVGIEGAIFTLFFWYMDHHK